MKKAYFKVSIVICLCAIAISCGNKDSKALQDSNWMNGYWKSNTMYPRVGWWPILYINGDDIYLDYTYAPTVHDEKAAKEAFETKQKDNDFEEWEVGKIRVKRIANDRKTAPEIQYILEKSGLRMDELWLLFEGGPSYERMMVVADDNTKTLCFLSWEIEDGRFSNPAFTVFESLSAEDPSSNRVVTIGEGELYGAGSSYPIGMCLYFEKDKLPFSVVEGYYFYKSKGEDNKIRLLGESSRPGSAMATYYMELYLHTEDDSESFLVQLDEPLEENEKGLSGSGTWRLRNVDGSTKNELEVELSLSEFKKK